MGGGGKGANLRGDRRFRGWRGAFLAGDRGDLLRGGDGGGEGTARLT